MSLNNRISFRDAYCARGGLAVDLQVVPFPINGDSLEARTETVIMDPEKAQKDPTGQPTEVEVDTSESHDRHLFSHD